jgi:DNA-binding CsgD family transcriptional regulator/PAS domain-containing protein
VVRPDGGFDGLLAVPFRHDGHVGLLAVERLRSAPDYDGEDADALQAILPHLSNALRIRLRLEDADATARQTYEAFDLLVFGVIIVDAGMRPVFMNRRAENITRRHDGLSVGKDGLQAANVDETRALGAPSLLPPRPRARGGEPNLAAPKRRITRNGSDCPDRRAEQALIATVMPMSAENGDRLIAARARAIIFLIEPGALLALHGSAVEAAFGLTPRQATLAVLLVRAASLRHAAAELSMAQETTRTHLKEIFERTHTRRQADLIRALSVAFGSVSAASPSAI